MTTDREQADTREQAERAERDSDRATLARSADALREMADEIEAEAERRARANGWTCEAFSPAQRTPRHTFYFVNRGEDWREMVEGADEGDAWLGLCEVAGIPTPVM
mgnify:CR=1 FL=1